jgi:polyhydroxyalkanoate synthesis regulator phasin
MNEEKIHQIGDEEIKDGDLTPEQHHHKNHVISLRNKIAKLQFEIDDLMPSLKMA